MSVRPITSNDYGLILQQDKAVYPTDSPVTKEVIQTWYAKNPEFGMIFEEDGKIVGDFIVVPLNKEGWEKLINGELAEAYCKDYIFDNSKDKEIGLHGYHMEKLTDMKEFYKIAFKALGKIINNLKMKNPELKVIGFSGLAVTPEGIGLCENKLNCKERDYISNENIMEKNSKKIVVKTDEVENGKKQGYNYLNRCKMLVAYPNEKSIIWEYLNTNNKNNPKEAILKQSEEPEGITIKGYDFNNGVDWEKIIGSFSSTGFQATHLARAIEIIKEMRKEKAYIYLGYTSNIISSGLREIIRYLAEKKLVDVIVTTAGGIEEDFIKCLDDFKLGDFRADGAMLREKGINRIGNIFVPNSRYVKFEEWVLPILEKHKNENLTPAKLINILGKEINDKNSVYYWCVKKDIKVFCPAIMDGSLGDMIYFFKSKNKDFKLDITDDAVELNNSSLGKHKTGMIILGGGVVKHSICNANLYRNGADYAVYINSNPEFDGSDSGALPEEAKSWGKITGEGKAVKVFGDATILFPIIVASTFAREN